MTHGQIESKKRGELLKRPVKNVPRHQEMVKMSSPVDVTEGFYAVLTALTVRFGESSQCDNARTVASLLGIA
jgi:hypothetical protein